MAFWDAANKDSENIANLAIEAGIKDQHIKDLNDRIVILEGRLHEMRSIVIQNRSLQLRIDFLEDKAFEDCKPHREKIERLQKLIDDQVYEWKRERETNGHRPNEEVRSP